MINHYLCAILDAYNKLLADSIKSQWDKNSKEFLTQLENLIEDPNSTHEIPQSLQTLQKRIRKPVDHLPSYDLEIQPSELSDEQKEVLQFIVKAQFFNHLLMTFMNKRTKIFEGTEEEKGMLIRIHQFLSTQESQIKCKIENVYTIEIRKNGSVSWTLMFAFLLVAAIYSSNYMLTQPKMLRCIEVPKDIPMPEYGRGVTERGLERQCTPIDMDTTLPMIGLALLVIQSLNGVYQNWPTEKRMSPIFLKNLPISLEKSLLVPPSRSLHSHLD